MGIRFCTEEHYITRDNVNPNQLDEATLRKFLKLAHHCFDTLRRNISTEMSHCRGTEAHTQLQTLFYLAQKGYTVLKKRSSRLKTANQLFSFAEESESVLRYITSTALALEYSTKTDEFTADIHHTTTCLNNHCKLTLSAMGCSLSSKLASTVH
ncbi:MAG: hypothetical protein K2Y22_14270 [Candidatus Obscuribacterales bacterium]|nr:hypothetical protein [Candidatus Obscuribacterales bacterium]